MKKDSTIMLALANVIDPDVQIPITDMGLIYGAEMKDDTAQITMTLTSIGCPLFDVIAADIKKNVGALKGVTDVQIDLTFDPPWSLEMMSEEARAEFGFD